MEPLEEQPTRMEGGAGGRGSGKTCWGRWYLSKELLRLFDKDKGRGRHLTKATGHKASTFKGRKLILKVLEIWQDREGAVCWGRGQCSQRGLARG